MNTSANNLVFFIVFVSLILNYLVDCHSTNQHKFPLQSAITLVYSNKFMFIGSQPWKTNTFILFYFLYVHLLPCLMIDKMFKTSLRIHTCNPIVLSHPILLLAIYMNELINPSEDRLLFSVWILTIFPIHLFPRFVNTVTCQCAHCHQWFVQKEVKGGWEMRLRRVSIPPISPFQPLSTRWMGNISCQIDTPHSPPASRESRDTIHSSISQLTTVTSTSMVYPPWWTFVVPHTVFCRLSFESLSLDVESCGVKLPPPSNKDDFA